MAGCTMCLFTAPNALDEPVAAYGGTGEGMGGLAPMEVGPPLNVKHVFHVTFDSGRFVGLPPELKAQLEGLELEHAGQAGDSPSSSGAVFGVPPETLECSEDEHGNSIPTVLLALQTRLYSLDGLQREGIFRVSGQVGDEAAVRRQLAQGTVPESLDVHALAGLVKAWFRELPRGILDAVSPPEMAAVNGEESALALIPKLPAVQAALLDWVLNLMADVVDHQAANRMNSRNIAMVFAPNLSQVVDPLVGLQHAVKVMDFLGLLIQKKQADRRAAKEAAAVAAALVQPSMELGDADGAIESITQGASPGMASPGSAAAAAAAGVGAAALAAAGSGPGSGGPSSVAAAGMTQAAVDGSRGAVSEHADPATSRAAGEDEALSAHGAGPSRFREAPDQTERRSRARASSTDNVGGYGDAELEEEGGSGQGAESPRPEERGEASGSRDAEAMAGQPLRSPKNPLRKMASTERYGGQQEPPGLADKPRPTKSTGKRPSRKVAQSGPVESIVDWEGEDEGSGRSARAGRPGGTRRTSSVGKATGTPLKESGAASYASDWSDGGDRQRRRGQKPQEPEREAGNSSDAETLLRTQSGGALKRFHALRVKLVGEKGVVGEPELAEDWAVPMSPLDAELLRASGVTPLRTLSVVAEQQRMSAAQLSGGMPVNPSGGGSASVASTPKGEKGGDRSRKAKKGGFDLVLPREEFGIGPPWVNPMGYLQDRPSSERKGRVEKESAERPSSERKGRAAVQEVQLDVRPSSEKNARAARGPDSKVAKGRLDKASSERRRSGEGEEGLQRKGATEGMYRRGASLQRSLGEPHSTAGGPEDWGQGGFADLAEPEGQAESKHRSRPPSQGEPRGRRASHLRQLLQTEQAQLQQQQLRSQWDALGPGGGEDSCEVVMVEEEEVVISEKQEEGEREVVDKRKGRRGRGPRESASHDFTSLASDHSGSAFTESDARRDEEAPAHDYRTVEGEPSRPQGKGLKGGLERRWTSHADRQGLDSLLSPRLRRGAEDSEGEAMSVSSQQTEESAEGKPRKKGKGKGKGSRGTGTSSLDPLDSSDNPPQVVRSSSGRKGRQQGDTAGQAEGSRRGKGAERPGVAQSAAERLSQHVLSALYGTSSEHPSGDRKGKQPERQVSSERRARPRVAMSDVALSWGYGGGTSTTSSGGGAGPEAGLLATPRRPATDRKAREGRSEDAAGGSEERKQGKGGLLERAATSSGREAAAEGGGRLRKAATERRVKGGEALIPGEKRGGAKGTAGHKPRRDAAPGPGTVGERQPPARGWGDPSGE